MQSNYSCHEMHLASYRGDWRSWTRGGLEPGRTEFEAFKETARAQEGGGTYDDACIVTVNGYGLAFMG